MPHPWFSFEALKQATQPHTKIIIQDTRKGAILFTEFGARLMGLFPDKSLPNTLWMNPDFSDCMKTKNWKIGGERIWIAPERHYYYKTPATFERFYVQPQHDPGVYKLIKDITFTSTFDMTDFNTNKEMKKCFTQREFAMIDDPFKTGLPYSGVAIHDTMTLTEPGLAICVWSVTQTYVCGADASGTGLIPVGKKAAPISYFNPIPADRIDVFDGYCRFRLDAAAIYKLAIRPQDIAIAPCQNVYISPYPVSDKWFIVAKRSDDLPPSEQRCCDFGKNDPDGPKGSIQSYNHGREGIPKEVYFGEIELQFDRGKTTGNSTTATAKHELLSYCGSKEEMLDLAKILLNLKKRPEVY